MEHSTFTENMFIKPNKIKRKQKAVREIGPAYSHGERFEDPDARAKKLG
jgi:hypothetical protein